MSFKGGGKLSPLFPERPPSMFPSSGARHLSLIRVICMVWLAALCGGASFSQQPKVLAPHQPVAPRLPRNRSWDKPAVLQTLAGGFWMTDANFKARLYLGN